MAAEFNLKKHLCILLGIILLVTNTQIFSQEENIISIVSKEEIEELSTMAKRIRIEYKMTLQNITKTSNIISATNIYEYNNPYKFEEQMSNSYKVYYEQINELAEHLQAFQNKVRKTYGTYIDALPEGTYLKKVTVNYINERMNTLFETQNKYLEEVLSISDIVAGKSQIKDISPIIKQVYFHDRKSRHEYLVKQYATDSEVRNSYIKNLADTQNRYQSAFSEDMDRLIKQLEKAGDSFSKETIEFFSKKEHTAEEIVKYFETRLPENQKAVLFALKVSDKGVTIEQLIPHIRYYLKRTNRRLWKLDQFSAERLATALSKMSTTERINCIDDLLDFAPETKALRSEIRQAEKTVGKKIVSRSGIKLSGTFMAIGAFFVASTIAEITADNNFYNSVGPYQLAQIKRKINEGQILSLQEMSAYYTDERNYAEIMKDPTGLLEVFEIAITINDCLDALNVDKSPFNPAKQEKKVKKVFDQYLEQVDLQKVTSQIGTI